MKAALKEPTLLELLGVGLLIHCARIARHTSHRRLKLDTTYTVANRTDLVLERMPWQLCVVGGLGCGCGTGGRW